MDQNQAKGSYYIRVREAGWYLWYQTWNQGQREQTKVQELAYRELGFDKFRMSPEEAKARCKQINRERSLIRDKIRRSANRIVSITTTNEILFPQSELKEFQEILTEENFGTDQYLKNLHYQFNYIQKMCTELRIQPSEYKKSSKKIFKYFMSQKTSLSYSCKLVNFLNRWGIFKSRKSGTFYELVPVPRGNEKSAIVDAQETKRGVNTEKGVRTASLPIVPSELYLAGEKLKIEHYNWLFMTVWLGLRPEEVDSLQDTKYFKIEKSTQHKISIIHVYQNKLKGIATEKRWKKIPLIFKEQIECLKIIESGRFERPLHKTVRNHLGQGKTLYGGRKAFTDLMLSKNQKLEDISLWLGHKDISMTWEHYKNKNQITFTETSETFLDKGGLRG